MTDVTPWLELSGLAAGAGGIGYAKVHAPRVYWSLVGLPVTWGRFTWTYRDTMEVCGLTVRPSGFRAFVKRNLAHVEVRPAPPKVRRVRPTPTGLRVTLRLPAGLEPADITAATERLRHAWGVHSVAVAETKPGYVELRMTGYDVLSRVRMPRKAQPRDLVVPVALREDGTVYERNYRQIPHSLTLGANQSGKSMYQRNLVKGLAQLPVGLVGIDCKRGVEQSRYAPRLSALATDRQTAGLLVDATSCSPVMAAANSAESAATRSAISRACGESAGTPACWEACASRRSCRCVSTRAIISGEAISLPCSVPKVRWKKSRSVARNSSSCTISASSIQASNCSADGSSGRCGRLLCRCST